MVYENHATAVGAGEISFNQPVAILFLDIVIPAPYQSASANVAIHFRDHLAMRTFSPYLFLIVTISV